MPQEPEPSRQCLASIPPGDAPWDVILGFLDDFAPEIDGYAYGNARGGFQRFLEKEEERFQKTGELSESAHELLALAYLVYRRHRWLEDWEGGREIEEHRPFVAALLEKARRIVRDSSGL